MSAIKNPAHLPTPFPRTRDPRRAPRRFGHDSDSVPLRRVTLLTVHFLKSCAVSFHSTCPSDPRVRFPNRFPASIMFFRNPAISPPPILPVSYGAGLLTRRSRPVPNSDRFRTPNGAAIDCNAIETFFHYYD